MQSVKKVLLVPAEDNQIGGSIENNAENGSVSTAVEQSADKIKSKIYDKIHRFIKVILKLAKTVGYDDDLRIKLKNGSYMEKTNIVDLLTHAMSTGKILYGENEFIELLSRSNVDPDLIINENVRLKLVEFKNKKDQHYEDSEVISNNVQKQKMPTLIHKNDIIEIRKGPKKIFVEKEDGTDEKEMPQLNSTNDIQQNNYKIKRKIDEISDDDSIDDDMIDSTRWQTN